MPPWVSQGFAQTLTGAAPGITSSRLRNELLALIVARPLAHVVGERRALVDPVVGKDLDGVVVIDKLDLALLRG